MAAPLPRRFRRERLPMRILLVLLSVTLLAIFFAYPPLMEESDGECSALDQRYDDLASRDGAGLLTVTPLYGSSSSSPSGRSFVKDRYPLLPAAMGCAVVYWKSMLDRRALRAPGAQASLS